MHVFKSTLYWGSGWKGMGTWGVLYRFVDCFDSVPAFYMVCEIDQVFVKSAPLERLLNVNTPTPASLN